LGAVSPGVRALVKLSLYEPPFDTRAFGKPQLVEPPFDARVLDKITLGDPPFDSRTPGKAGSFRGVRTRLILNWGVLAVGMAAMSVSRRFGP
jgi:hypothetical protein